MHFLLEWTLCEYDIGNLVLKVLYFWTLQKTKCNSSVESAPARITTSQVQVEIRTIQDADSTKSGEISGQYKVILLTK